MELVAVLRDCLEKAFGSDNPVTKNVVLTIQVINFGDGAGYLIGVSVSSSKKNSLRLPRAVIRSVYGFILRRGATVELRPAF